MEEISTEQMAGYMDTAVEMTMTYGPQLILAILVLVIGLWIINRFVRLMGAGMEKSNTEPTLAKFLCNLASVVLKALLLISVASMIGIETTSFIAVLGAAGLAIGLALQGSLANFAGGVLVLMFRPYKVGDFIDAQGVMGTVHEIQIFNTILKTPDNKVIIVPNGSISNGIITNFSVEATRRVDFVFGIGYSDDIAKAKATIERLVKEDGRALADPAPQIVVSELGDSSVNITTRVWVNAADYWGLFFDLTEKVKLTFDQEGISIPFPQRDVHVFQQNG
ncbi:MAG: mechanosensitive ion channel [Gammaproteobacteria bacterium]|jgi:small conductance mechanosensitive channel|nr:MAG: mechanosensitive ion channel [Gammaproteobacteria bacterium]